MFNSSAHNTRIERYWKEVTRVLGAKWKRLFVLLKSHFFLNEDLARHKWLLSYLFLQDINDDLIEFQGIYNDHQLSTCQGLTPNQMFLQGTIEHGLRGLDWAKPGDVDGVNEEVVDHRSYAAGDGTLVEPDIGQGDLDVVDDQVRQQVDVFDQRCPFSQPDWKMEMDRRVYGQNVNMEDPVARWTAGLNAMRDLLDLGWGH